MNFVVSVDWIRTLTRTAVLTPSCNNDGISSERVNLNHTSLDDFLTSQHLRPNIDTCRIHYHALHYNQKTRKSLNIFVENFKFVVAMEFQTLILPHDHLLLDSAPNIGQLISRWEINKFENCWYKSVGILEVLKLLFHQFLNLSSSQRDMSGPILGDLFNNRCTGVRRALSQNRAAARLESDRVDWRKFNTE
jgi:hypothetical protein